MCGYVEAQTSIQMLWVQPITPGTTSTPPMLQVLGQSVHPGEAISCLLHGEHLSGVFFDSSVSLPKLQSFIGRLKIRTEIRGVLLAK